MMELGQGERNSEGRVPNIGVMCMDLAKGLAELYEGNYCHMSANYVKHLEASGALIVPIWIGRERDYYAQIMTKVNGILLPGGAVYLEDSEVKEKPELTNDCVKSARYIYELAMERNEAGNYFPIWGTCLGFQLLLINAAKTNEVRTECGRFFKALPLHWSTDSIEGNSTMLADLSPELAEQMQKIPFACHQHRYCIEVENLHRYALHKDWRILATRESATESPSEPTKRFITLIEHRRFPIFGSQFHPERAAHELGLLENDNCSAAHTRLGIQLAQYYAEFFVEACRRNTNRFSSNEEKLRYLIFNWQPVFSGLKHSNCMQCYIFPRDVEYPQ
ncbi:gamma-glutamyl hydrolase isoform X2 [Drosophila grimshawi]|nr:gamma-glutamyl hydrolase isoform X2 [Drosophila grimshawi]XP_032591749.1 gamma-glutamyl hydrolase isoform X2 [Drosophila grimshawi]